MRLAWATDIHLNFVGPEEIDRFCRAVRESGADRLVISGDIAEAHDLADSLGCLADLLPVPIDYVLGNHDFYGGRIDPVRAAMAVLTRRVEQLNWLPEAGVVGLSPEVALVGVDGWGDARLGDFAGSTVRLNDYRLIGDLAGLGPAELRDRLGALGDESAAIIRRVLPEALDDRRIAIVATHVPPFREACVFKGRVANDDWMPHFSCHAVGEALAEIMASRPDRRLVVLCGHVHSPGVARVSPNIVALTGMAEYRRPEIRRLFDLPGDLDALFDDPPVA